MRPDRIFFTLGVDVSVGVGVDVGVVVGVHVVGDVGMFFCGWGQPLNEQLERAVRFVQFHSRDHAGQSC